MIDLATWRANIGALASRSYTQRDTRQRFFAERVLKQRTKPPQRFTAVQCKSEEVAIPHALLNENSTVVTPLPTKASRGRNIASVSKEGPAQRSSMPMRAAPQGNSGRWCSSVAVKMMCGTLLFLGLCLLLLRVAGDVEVNPGPGRLDQVPTLRELLCLECTDTSGLTHKIHIRDEVAHKWMELAAALDFDVADIRNIEKNNKTVEECCYELMQRWLQRGGQVTWDRLLVAIETARCGTLTWKLRKFLSGNGTLSAHPHRHGDQYTAGPSHHHDQYTAGPSHRHDQYTTGPSHHHDQYTAGPSHRAEMQAVYNTTLNNFDEFLKNVPLNKRENKFPETGPDFIKIAEEIIDWRKLCPYFNLTQAEEEEIVGINVHSVINQKIAFLRKWRAKKYQATYVDLARLFHCAKEYTLMNLVLSCIRLSDSQEEGSISGGAENEENVFREYHSIVTCSLSTHCPPNTLPLPARGLASSSCKRPRLSPANPTPHHTTSPYSSSYHTQHHDPYTIPPRPQTHVTPVAHASFPSFYHAPPHASSPPTPPPYHLTYTTLVPSSNATAPSEFPTPYQLLLHHTHTNLPSLPLRPLPPSSHLTSIAFPPLSAPAHPLSYTYNPQQSGTAHQTYLSSRHQSGTHSHSFGISVAHTPHHSYHTPPPQYLHTNHQPALPFPPFPYHHWLSSEYQPTTHSHSLATLVSQTRPSSSHAFLRHTGLHVQLDSSLLPCSSQTIANYSTDFSISALRYIKYLMDSYSSKRSLATDKDHGVYHHKSSYYINLALVHKEENRGTTTSERGYDLMHRLRGQLDYICKKKTELDITGVGKCKDGRLASAVLVEGAPGVGKTTFCIELCQRWAKGELLQDWSMVVLIQLRDTTIRTAQSLHDLLYYPINDVKQAVCSELIRSAGKGVLIILDGYDELSDSQRSVESVFQQLMSRQLLPQATLMVTSRPIATKTLHNAFSCSIDQHIEILGFTENDIQCYIHSVCGDEPALESDLKSYISSHPFSSAVMHIPLQCAIVTDLYCTHWEHGNKCFAPKTLTELYTGLVNCLLLRYLNNHPIHHQYDWLLNTPSDLPQDVHKQFKEMCKLAADGIMKRQYVFDQVPEETLGLMQRVEEVYAGRGTSVSHSFLHLTLQEYLAAVHFSQHKHPQQLTELLTNEGLFPLDNFLENYCRTQSNSDSSSSAAHWPVLLFIAGMTKLSGVPHSLLKSDIDSNGNVAASLAHLLYEIQSTELIQSILVTTSNQKRLRAGNPFTSALDWFMYGYCIASSTAKWRIAVYSDEKFSLLTSGLNMLPYKNESSSMIKYTILTLYAESLTAALLHKILLSPFAQNLQFVDINEFADNAFESCDLYSNCPMLRSLTITGGYYNTIPESLTQWTISPQNCLQTLELYNCNLHEHSSSLTQSLQSPHCKLHTLILSSSNGFLPSFLSVIGNSTTIRHLCLELNLSLLVELTSALIQNKIFKKVALFIYEARNRNVDERCTEQEIVAFLKVIENSVVTKLWLPDIYEDDVLNCEFSRDDICIEYCENSGKNWYDISEEIKEEEDYM